MSDDLFIPAHPDPVVMCERVSLEMARRFPLVWTLFVHGRIPATPPSEPAATPPDAKADRLLGAKETAERLGYSVDWLYRNSRSLPFTRHVGRGVRFSESGLNRYIKSRDTAGRKGA